MKSMLTIFGVFVVFIAIAAFCYGGYLALVYLWQGYAELDVVIRTVLLSAMAVVLIAALLIAGAIKAAGVAAGKSQLTAEKLSLYKSMIDSLKPLFAHPEQISQKVCADVLSELSAIEGELQILSAGVVLENYAKLETALRDRDLSGQINELVEKLIKSIRRDLGHGSGYDETRLKLLVTSMQAENVERPNPRVSI